VGTVQSARQVVVGSERDLPYVPEAALAVAVDADSLLMAPHYRAEDDAVRLLARVASTVARGSGRRCLVQTAQPNHRGLAALRNGHPIEFLNTLNQERQRDHLPPAASLIAVEVVGEAASRTADVETLAGPESQVHGPEVGGGRTRWFIQGESIQQSRVQLRTVVQRWRDSGLKVRIDADPIDL
jgi:primosomal protein N'